MIELPEAVVLAKPINQTLVSKPCPVCSTTIKKGAYLGGSIYFCHECQKEVA